MRRQAVVVGAAMRRSRRIESPRPDPVPGADRGRGRAEVEGKGLGADGNPSRVSGRPDAESGSGTLLAAVVVVPVVLLGVIGALVGVYAAEGTRVTGAADLVAVAAGEAQRWGRPACEAARRAAAANGVRVVSCTVAGDEVEFVVSVRVEGLAAPASELVGRPKAEAHAGVITGAPE